MFKKLYQALCYSLQGIRVAMLSEFACRLEMLLSIVVIPLGIFLGHDGVSRALLVGSWVLIFIVELINTAIETLVDRVGPEYHDLSKKAKDVASAAVFAAVMNALLIWVLVVFG